MLVEWNTSCLLPWSERELRDAASASLLRFASFLMELDTATCDQSRGAP